MSETADESGAAFREGPLSTFTRPLAIAGGLLSVVLACIVVANILLRWLLDSQVPGDIELVQIGTALTIFAFFPLCQARRGNIFVDTFTMWLPQPVRDRLDALWDLLYCGLALVIAWRLAVGAYDAMRSNTVSMMLGLPTGWAIAACAVMAAFLALVAAATAARLLRRRA
jgi:TRAP-type C4-dicarboxylate transport system permease small subunit